REDDAPPAIVPWAQRLMQLQISVLYLCASLSKITGATWMDGTAVYYPLHLPESLRFPALGRDNIYVINVMTWATIAIEMALATFVWVPRLRLYVLTLGIFLHLGIEYTFNIPLFSALMITSYLNFLTGDDIKHVLAWAKRPLALTPLRLVYDGECDFCKSSLLVVRFLDVFRQITFVNAHDRAALKSTGVRAQDAEQAAVAVRPDGRQFAGFDAFRLVAWQLPATVLIAPLLYIPPIPQIGRRVYTWVKDNRHRLPVAPRYKAKPVENRETLTV
ncbi:MAG: DCC1-like thiol-disulfide oxidoreductase family protein, partial [Armatimonadota bacterium]|nr:DCC1-like thiol-disulfide oxidoreductase family protein [Armatimonadota bacterium]